VHQEWPLTVCHAAAIASTDRSRFGAAPLDSIQREEVMQLIAEASRARLGEEHDPSGRHHPPRSTHIRSGGPVPVSCRTRMGRP